MSTLSTRTDEAGRVAELRRYGILDTPRELAFDRIADIAAALFQVPMAVISFVDQDRIWFKARHGLDVQQAARDPGMCASAIGSDDVYVIPDTRKDPATASHPMVRGDPAVRFYAAAPLHTPRGYNIGTVCILDLKPRELSPEQKDVLKNLAGLVVDELELRRGHRAMEQAAVDEALLQERRLFMGGPSVVFKWKAQEGWPMEYVSPNVTQFGYKPQDLTSGRVQYAQMVHPKDLDRVANEVKAYSESGVPCFDQEYRILMGDGQVRWVHDFTVVVRDGQNKITHYHGYVMDITVRKLAEEALRDSSAKYEAVVDAFDGLIYICSEDYKVEFMNKPLVERTGYDAVGEPCYRALHKLDGVCPWCVNDTVFRGKTVRWEVLSPKDNRWFYIVNTPIRHADGRMSKMAMIQDITERKQAEETVRRREAILEAIGFASEQFLKKASWEQSVQAVLARLGQAVGVSRVRISENSRGLDGAPVTSQRYGWQAPGVASKMYSPELHDFGLRARGFQRWEEQLSAGQTIVGHVKEFPAGERGFLSSLDIKSILVMPIFVEQAWWGFTAFDSCGTEREWSAAEIDALKTAVSLLGASIERRQTEEALRRSEEKSRVILNAMPDLMFRLAKDGTFLDFKAEKDTDLAVPPDRIIGGKISDLLPGPVAQLTMFHINRALRTKEKQIYEYQLGVGGAQRDFETRMVVSGKDEVLAMVRDITERRKAEAQLSILSSAVNQTADSVVITDRDGVIEYVNPAFEKLTGYSKAEVIGKTPAILKSGKHDKAFYEKLWGTLLSGEVFRTEFVNRRKNGQLYHQGETITPIKDGSGKMAHFVASGRDISERVAAQEALKESERRLSDIINFLPDATFAIDAQGKVIAWNRAIEAMTGVKAADMLGRGNYEYALPFYRTRRPVLADLVLKPNEAAEKEYTYVERVNDTLMAEVYMPLLKARGTYVWAIATPLYDARGNVVGAIESVRDITERKAAEESIRKLAVFPQFNPSAVLEFMADGTLSYFNKAAKDMAVSLGSENPMDILPANTQQIVREALEANESRVGIETTMGKRIITWSFLPIPETETVHGYGFDVTERRNLETQLWQLQKMEAVGRLAAGVAHDFNNVLTAILGYASMILVDEGLRPDVMQQVKEIVKAADRASNLTRQLLTFGRKQVMQPKVLNLNEVLSGVSQMLRRLVSEDISLDVRCNPDLPNNFADETMMDQVVVNLVINARDAVQGGGGITITTSAVEVGRAQVRDNPEAKEGRFVLLGVRDTGCGITDDMRSRIFEPFFTTKESGKGVGLGLATVYGIVKQHEGWIEVESEPQRGSLFKVYLPVYTGPVKRAAPEPQKPAVRGGKETILVVEDEATVRALACSILSQYGYSVLEASSGADGLAVWERNAPRIDMLLADVIMPGGITGRDLADLLRQKKSSLKVLLTSGYHLEAIGQQFTMAQDMKFLPKPFSPEELARAVRSCLDG